MANLWDFPGFNGDGVTDDSTVVQGAIAWCQSNNDPVLRVGAYRIALYSRIICAGAPIAILGEPGPAAQGSAASASAFLWRGGTDDMFEIQSSAWIFKHLTFENRGSGQSPFYLQAGQQHLFEELYFISNGNNPSPWADFAFRSLRNEGGYCTWRNNRILGAARGLIHWTGLSTSGNGVTSGFIYGGLFESTSDGDVTLVKLTDSAMDLLVIADATFDQQAGEMTVVDTQDSDEPITIATMIVSGIEIDNANAPEEEGVEGFRQFRLKNVGAASLYGIDIQGGGRQAAIGTLENSKVSLGVHNAVSVGGPIFAALDDVSAVNVAGPFRHAPSTAGVFDGSGIVDLHPAGNIYTIPGYQYPNTVFRVLIEDAYPKTLSLVQPGISPGGVQTPGTPFDLLIENGSNGAVTIDAVGGSSYWLLAGGALPQPAAGKYVALRLVWEHGIEKFRELSRSAEIG